METYRPKQISNDHEPSELPSISKKTFFSIVSLVVLIVASILTYSFFFQKPVLLTQAGAIPTSPFAFLFGDADLNQNLKCKQAQTIPENFDPKSAKFANLAWPNNKVGVYAYAEQKSLDSAAKLVNSNGGDWGYVLIPYNINEINKDQVRVWNEKMAMMCQKHLLPIVQLFNSGKIPTVEQTKKTAEFLSQLNWPVKTKFITVYNETNAAEYWDHKIDPEGYADVLSLTIDELKKHDKNFFIMNGAFNTSAVKEKITTDLGVNTEYMEASEYMARMNAQVPGIFKKLDGWAAHCYPNPHYLGKPLDIRPADRPEFEQYRGTMRSYLYDLKLLETFGASHLPVFITETGWPHAEGTDYKNEYLPAKTVAEYYKTIFEEVYLKDDRVVAVTPFIVSLDGGIDNFAFIDKNNKQFPQFDSVLNVKKIAGRPPLD